MSKVITWEKGLVMPNEIDPSDVVQYSIDLSTFLGDDAITASSAVGENIDIDNVSHADQKVTIIVSSPVEKRAKIRFTVTTAVETFNRSFYVNVDNL